MGLRQTKKYHAKDTEGFVCNINNLNNINLLKDKWLILARTVSRTREIAKELKRQGIYFKIKDMKSFSTKLYRCIVNYTKWTKGETIEQTELDDVIECIGHDQLDKNKTWFECFDKASLEEKNYIRLMLGNKEKLDEEPRVQLSTIHAAKGGECENVILVLDNTNKIRKSTERNIKKKDEEHRVWYVGATRAKQNLYLLRSKIARKGYQLYDG
jgi:superfamily I DNA/RNA helicase